jgi:chorismate lyase/3-hydroxybenzoate synthase
MQDTPASKSISIHFDGSRSSCSVGEQGAELSLEIPLLLGSACKPLLKDCSTISESNGFIIGENENQMAGIACIEVENSPEDPALELYNSLIRITGQRQIHRIWNYVPGINEERNKLENYRSFNIGRHRAFVSAYGENYSSRISPASAVGANGTSLAVAFIAGDDVMHNVENPEQTPAYNYPTEHGPKSPSFTRGSHGTVAGAPTAHLSGTASIKKDQSVGNNDFASQYETTIDNMQLVTRSLGYPSALGSDGDITREFTFYLRNSEDLATATGLFRETTGQRGIECTRFLHADICRSELLLEIEGSFSRPLVN